VGGYDVLSVRLVSCNILWYMVIHALMENKFTLIFDRVIIIQQAG
jgi:hypothetical protein